MTTVLREERLPVLSDVDVVRVRRVVRERAAEARLSLVDQTKLVTAASELARNCLEHGGGGEALVELVEATPRRGVRVTLTDEGPGIPNVDLAMRDGYTTGSGLGLGLGGAKRLVNEFEIDSAPGRGTRVAVVRWR